MSLAIILNPTLSHIFSEFHFQERTFLQLVQTSVRDLELLNLEKKDMVNFAVIFIHDENAKD